MGSSDSERRTLGIFSESTELIDDVRDCNIPESGLSLDDEERGVVVSRVPTGFVTKWTGLAVRSTASVVVTAAVGTKILVGASVTIAEIARGRSMACNERRNSRRCSDIDDDLLGRETEMGVVAICVDNGVEQWS
jgi:hypothetical protein